MSEKLNEGIFNFVGIEYKYWDCVQLVRKFYECFFSMKFDIAKKKREPGQTKEEYLHSLFITNKRKLESVSKPKFGDLVVFMNTKGLLCHIGVVVRPGIYLHSVKNNKMSSLDFLNLCKNYGYHVAGFFRPIGKPEKIELDHVHNFWKSNKRLLHLSSAKGF